MSVPKCKLANCDEPAEVVDGRVNKFCKAHGDINRARSVAYRESLRKPKPTERAMSVKAKPVESKLTKTEEVALIGAEAVVRKGLSNFIEVGDALAKIRDGRLYRGEFGTFEDYCQTKWGMARQYANNIIRSAAAARQLETNDSNPLGGESPVLPANEAVAREVAKVSEEERAAVWEKAVETAPTDAAGKPKVTAAHVRKVADDELPDLEIPPDPVDAVGVAVPERKSLRAAFGEGVEQFDAALRLLKQVKGILNGLLGNAADADPDPGGEELAAMRQDVLGYYKNLYNAVAFAKPHAVCPYCKGKGCKECHKLGWMTKESLARVPNDLNGRAA